MLNRKLFLSSHLYGSRCTALVLLTVSELWASTLDTCVEQDPSRGEARRGEAKRRPCLNTVPSCTAVSQVSRHPFATEGKGMAGVKLVAISRDEDA